MYDKKLGDPIQNMGEEGSELGKMTENYPGKEILEQVFLQKKINF